MKAHKLGQKRHNKKLKRKNKKYAGPKYSRLEQYLLWTPMLEKAGIIEPEISEITGDNNTMFT